MIISFEQIKDKLLVSYVKDDGNLGLIRINIPDSELYNWVIVENNNIKTNKKNWDGKPVIKKKSFILNKFRILEFLYSFNEGSDVSKNLFEKYNKPNIFYFDIETDIDDQGFPDPESARCPIISISILNDKNNDLIILTTKNIDDKSLNDIKDKIKNHLKDYIKDDFKIIFKCYESEKLMLQKFIDFSSNLPCLCGWNIDGFDLPYIINRCKKIGVDYTKISKTGTFDGYYPNHILFLDFMNVFKVFDRSLDVIDNYKLDYIASSVLKIGKVKYSGSLKDLYENNYKDFLFYNAIDVFLLKYIQYKNKTIDIFFSLAHLSKIPALKVFSSIYFTEAVLVNEFMKKSIVIVPNNNKNKEDYIGGLVRDPVPGYYENVISSDFSSLYPSIMRQFNISPETYIGDIDKIDISKYNKNDLIICKNNAVFDGSKDSAMRIILTDLYNQRKKIKKEMQQLEIELEKLKSIKKTI